MRGVTTGEESPSVGAVSLGTRVPECALGSEALKQWFSHLNLRQSHTRGCESTEFWAPFRSSGSVGLE